MTKTTGTGKQSAHTFDEARQFIGNIGDVDSGGTRTDVGHGVARDTPRQVIGNAPIRLCKTSSVGLPLDEHLEKRNVRDD